MTITDSGAGHDGPSRNTERVNTTMNPETRQQLERLRDLLPAHPTVSQVVRYAVRELYLRETCEPTATFGKD